MLTLSIQQPWAWAILNAGKDVENRSWSTRYRGEILIHAGKKVDRDGYDFLLSEFGIDAPHPEIIYRGGIVGMAEIIDCVTKSDSQWFFGPNGFVLKNQRILPYMPVRGQLGFFDVKYDTNQAFDINQDA